MNWARWRSSHEIDEDVHDSSKVSDDGGGGEEQAVGHDLQVELDAHEDHKHVLPDLKREGVTANGGVRSLAG